MHKELSINEKINTIKQKIKNISDIELQKIMLNLYNHDFNDYPYYILINNDISKYRTIRQILKFIDLFSEQEYNNYFVFDLIIDENILKSRTFKEQLELIKIVRKSNYHLHSYILSKNIYLLSKTSKEQIKLINAYLKYNCGINSYEISLDFSKSVEEQIQLLKKEYEINNIKNKEKILTKKVVA